MNQNETTKIDVTATNAPRIYVASLSDYNSGRLHGRWISAAQEPDAIHAEILAMLAESVEAVAEEWAIHDCEGFGSVRLDEYEDIVNVTDLANLIEKHGELFAELVAHVGGGAHLEEAKRYMEEGYRGEFERIQDYAQELVEDCYCDILSKLPDFLRYHIDYEGVAHDMEIGGDIFTIRYGGMFHVFDPNI